MSNLNLIETMGRLFSGVIDKKLASLLRPVKLNQLVAVKKTFPTFRFPDFHRAANVFLKDKKVLGTICSLHHEELPGLFQPTNSYGVQQRRLNVAPLRLVDVGWREEESFPEDCFWCFEDRGRKLSGILRIKKCQHTETEVELAVNSSPRLQTILDEIIDLSVRHSVYKNNLLAVDFEEDIQDEYSSVQSPNRLTVSFRPDPQVTADKIVLAEEIERVLERNVVSFHRERSRLRELGLPLQRGILLHGPPGTGKTFTCQYLYGRLRPVTMIVVSGKGLTEVKSICNLARMLQPSVVVLEDVDLIFTAREINLYSTGLGEMMDELDGFQKDDSIVFVLTTNAIERLEEAIKDRPGRISQCVFFGPPTQELRCRYLEHFLRSYDCSQLSIEAVAKISDGASQAFLQELVYRAVQIAAESTPKDEDVKLIFQHFNEAVEEMTGFTEKASASIIGFTSKSPSRKRLSACRTDDNNSPIDR